MEKLLREHPRQKGEQVQKPRDGEGSHTSEENKGGQRLGARRGKRKEAFAEEGGWSCTRRGLVGQERLGSLAAATAAASSYSRW